MAHTVQLKHPNGFKRTRNNTSGKMEVRVKWKGYSKTNWEPVSAVKHTNAWKSYAKKKKLTVNPVAVKLEKGDKDKEAPVVRVNK